MKIFSHFCPQGQVNTYLVTEGKRKCDALIIDPADLDADLISIIEKYELNIAGLLVTHDHEQHVRGIGKIEKVYPCPVYAFKDSVQGFDTVRLREGKGVRISDFSMDILYVPGHSPDSLAFVIGNCIFTGDTLAAGRVSTTTNNLAHAILTRNISQKIMTYDDNFLIFPGHGCPTKIRIERLFNHDLLESEVQLSENLF